MMNTKERETVCEMCDAVMSKEEHDFCDICPECRDMF